jgi:hypothetical protein
MLIVLILAKPNAESQGQFTYDDVVVIVEIYQLICPAPFELKEI